MLTTERDNRQIVWGSVVALGMSVGMWLFRVDDPYGFLLLVLLVLLLLDRKHFCWSFMDVSVTCICLFDILDYTSTFCFIAYLTIRKIISGNNGTNFLLKTLLFPFIIALLLVAVTFIVFVDSVHNAGFSDTYPFRFLFTPLGYITNAWANIYLPILGLLGVGWIRLPRYRIVFGCFFVITSFCVLLSFSRGAFIAWGVFMILLFFIIRTWKKKIVFSVFVVGVCISVWSLFPDETTTTLSMNKTLSQRQSTDSRFNATRKTFEVWKEHSLLGTGYNTYDLMMDRTMNQDTSKSFTSYAPNIVVQLMIEKGIVGLFLYISLIIAVIVLIFRNRKRIETMIIGACLFALLIKEMTISIMLETPVAWLLVYVMLALMQTKEDKGKITIVKCPLLMYRIVLVWGGLCFMVHLIGNLQKLNEQNKLDEVSEALKVKHYKKAIEIMEKIPDNNKNRINYAMLVLNVPDSLLPISYVEKALNKLEKIDNSYDIYIDYVQTCCLLRMGKIKRAESILRRLVTVYPNSAEYKYSLSKIYYKEGKLQEAKSLYIEALRLYPRLIHVKSADCPLVLDTCFRNQVVSDLIPSSGFMENTPDAFARYGYLSFEIGKKEDSKMFLEKALEHRPDFATPWLLTGKLYERLGKCFEAENCYRKYNLLIKGAFSEDKRVLHRERREYVENRLLFARYAVKFQRWYGGKLIF